MEKHIVEKINLINQEFYRNFAKSFSATRGHIQPGVARLLIRTSKIDRWLDIGCGNGTLAQALVEQDFSGRYLGCDFSQGLIKEAAKRLNSIPRSTSADFDFLCMDVNQGGWDKKILSDSWDILSAFAVLHHIPSVEQRTALCRQIRDLLLPNSKFYLSVWQLKNSARLSARIQPWETAGIRDNQVDEGDVLMDWRANQAQGERTHGLRYVHIFSEDELGQLAQDANFKIVDTFYSDGKEGNLALYQVWTAG